ncbi:unnamed protein product [Cuscuta epithymum]|uniref:Protein CHUP1, chloroplastic n=1 Tax=Cuscuta epithymum TaxID=186058 RepID=A0AAV0F4K2_9ASTE|nr:unnamed protein product [Cuscuta epithymum]
MVAGKVKVAMGLQKSPANPKLLSSDSSPKPHSPSPCSGKKPQKGALFSRSFGVYFPRSSAQVQPRPPDVAELLRLVEVLRERESRLKTELLEQKLLKESAALVPVLENEISERDSELQRSHRKVECLEAENDRLRVEVEVLHLELFKQRGRSEEKLKLMEAEILELKRVNEELASAHRFMDAGNSSQKLSLTKCLRKCATQPSFSLTIDNGRADCERSRKEEVSMETNERPRHSRSNSEEMAETSENLMSLRSRVPRVPKPPPRPSSSSGSSTDSSNRVAPEVAHIPPPPPPPPTVQAKVIATPAPPRPPTPPAPPSSKSAPPPPPPPPKGLIKHIPAKMVRVPEVVEFYHSLMRRDSRRESGGSCDASAPAVAMAKDMIGEIENRSSHLLAIKTDVEIQGDFIRFLIKEVESAAFTDIEDVVLFVKWLDDELSYLVDERAVLKHFDWPEKKADALREAAFGYSDIKKLVTEASLFRDDHHRQPCGPALKKMQTLFEKLEHGVYTLSRMRESASNRYRLFQIPMEWMLDTGYANQMKLASVKLAMKYMKRVSAELEMVGGCPDEEELIVQGVKFAFRVHQFAGGFDVETMRAFQELREKAASRSWHHLPQQCQTQQHKTSQSSRPSTAC